MTQQHSRTGSDTVGGSPHDATGWDLTRLAVSATVHCLPGCAIGEAR